MKSKGRVTYWTLRDVGEREVLPFAGTAHTAEELLNLGLDRDDHNKHVKKLGGTRVELVRVEVTPV